MNYRNLGRSGLKVSELCLGAWVNFGGKLEDAASHAVLDEAWEAGINFFDTADIYANGKAEEVMGRWMKGKDRRQLVVATKGWCPMWDGPNGRGASRKHLMDACHDSLRRLDTDYIDLYQIHAPDTDTPLEETMRTLDDLVKSGKVRYIGCSNFNSELIGEAARLSELYNLNRFISSQPVYNLLMRDIEEKDIPRCVREGLGLIPYSPLMQGLLSEKYLAGDIPAGSRAEGNEYIGKILQEKLPVVQQLGELAHSRGWKLAPMALAWLLRQPAMAAPIIGATRPEQVQENLAACDITLSEDDLKAMDEITRPAAEEG